MLDKFLNITIGADGKIPRVNKKAEQNVPPKQDSLNLRHKFLYALLKTYPSFDKGFIDMVLDNTLSQYKEATGDLQQKQADPQMQQIFDGN